MRNKEMIWFKRYVLAGIFCALLIEIYNYNSVSGIGLIVFALFMILFFQICRNCETKQKNSTHKE